MLLGNPNRKIWLESYQARTQKNARNSLKHFDAWLLEKNTTEEKFFEFLKNTEEIERYLQLKEFVAFLQIRLSPQSARLMMVYIKSWFYVWRVKLEELELRKNVKFQKILKERKYTPDNQMLATIVSIALPKYKPLIYFLVATGCRLNEAMQIKIKDINTETDPVLVRFPAEITKSKSEKISFLTLESQPTIFELMKTKKPDELLFGHIERASFYAHWEMLVKRAGFSETFTGIKRTRLKLTPHRIRAFTKLRLSEVHGDDFSHAILGHAEGLLTYSADNDEKMGEKYKSAEANLTLDQKAKRKEQDKKQIQMESEIEKLKSEIERLKFREPD